MRTYLEGNIGFKISSSIMNLMIFIPLSMIAFMNINNGYHNQKVLAFAVAVPLFIMGIISFVFPITINKIMKKIFGSKYQKSDLSIHKESTLYQLIGFIWIVLSYLLIGFTII